jgi:hypothetical protein
MSSLLAGMFRFVPESGPPHVLRVYEFAPLTIMMAAGLFNHPVWRSAGPIRPISALGDDPFQASSQRFVGAGCATFKRSARQ